MRKKRGRKYGNFFDYNLLFVVLCLLGFGLVMVYSVSSYVSMQERGISTFYLKKQIISTVVGLTAMTVVALIPYHFWERFAPWGYLLSCVLVLLIIPFGVERNGAKRWLYIGNKVSLQPAEVVKMCLILFLAGFICKMGRRAIGTWKGICLVLLLTLPSVLMIVGITSNLSSAIIVLGIAVLMLFVASPDYKKFIIMALAVVLVAVAAVFIIVNAQESIGFRGERVLAWLNPEAYADDKGFQTLQALYAIGSGGFFGKGLGQSMQKMGFLPEAPNDMIFSIICEELGLFGAMIVIFLFIMLIWRLMVIASNAADLFGSMLAVGVMAHISIQVILNIAVVTATIPNTGISLPFISYGGSSVLFLLIEIGLVLSVSRGIKLKE